MPVQPLRAAPIRTFEPTLPVVGHERLLRMQGYSNLERVRPAISGAAFDMARRAEGLSQPKVAYRYLPVHALDAQSVQVSTGGRLHSRAFQSRLSGCVEIVPFVLSCGAEIGKVVIDLAERGDLLEAVLLETAGWLCIEDATRQFKDLLRQETAAQGCRITSRMGPGYAYRVDGEDVSWPLEDQVELFRLFGEGQLPVALMTSCAMNPKLSRSGLFGVAPLYTHAFEAASPGTLN